MIARKPAARSTATSVTFTLPAAVAVASVSIVGSFNDWVPAAHPMKLDAKKGLWSKTILFKPGRHSFRYFADNETWINDPAADETEATSFGSANSVLVI